MIHFTKRLQRNFCFEGIEWKSTHKIALILHIFNVQIEVFNASSSCDFTEKHDKSFRLKFWVSKKKLQSKGFWGIVGVRLATIDFEKFYAHPTREVYIWANKNCINRKKNILGMTRKATTNLSSLRCYWNYLWINF